MDVHAGIREHARYTAVHQMVSECAYNLSEVRNQAFLKCSMVPVMLPHVSDEYRSDGYLPMRPINSFAALILSASLHHHVFEYRTQMNYYVAASVRVPILSAEQYTPQRFPGFASRREVSVPITLRRPRAESSESGCCQRCATGSATTLMVL